MTKKGKKNKKNYFFFLTSILLFSLIVKLILLGRDLSEKIRITNTLDLSWQTDMVERLLHGYLAGRDFIFTYGPLYQIFSAIPAVVFKLPSYTSFLLAPILLTLINGLIIIAIVKFVGNKGIKNALFSGLLILFFSLFSFPDPNNIFRLLSPILYAIVYIRFASFEYKSNIKFYTILSIPTILGLYSFDLFFTTFAITLLLILYDSLLKFKREGSGVLKSLIKPIVLRIVVIIIFEIIASVIISGNLNYLIYSIDTARSYQFIENIPWVPNKVYLLFILPILLIFISIPVFLAKNLNNNVKHMLAAMVIASLILLRSGLIRSDDSHIITAVYPSIVTLLFLVFIFKKRLIFPLILVLLFYIVLPYKINFSGFFRLQNVTSMASLISTKQSFFSIYKLPSNYLYKKTDFNLIEKIVVKNKGDVMIYPYDTYLLNIYSTTFNTTPLQFYDYSNSIVENAAVAALKSNPPSFIILEIDNLGVPALDNIPNFSRNPILAKWMISNYSVHKVMKKYLILKFNPSKNIITQEKCATYEINTKNIMQPNILDSLFKPSTYYLNSIKIRLPYSYNTQNIFIVKDYDNLQAMHNLFNSKVNFQNSKKTSIKNLKIIKKYPIPKISKTYNSQFSLNCFE